ncbi:MAG: CDP-glycerol glycerophosphotransferase family protein [Pseudobutyrivibrio sp.]|nr:CDP-glycerol glycerophosphotransferase family protein [Pseudobutyrivibrio sp.]
MRKYKVKQVENYIALFRKIAEGVCEALNPKNEDIPGACQYLELCQQKAIDFGTFIENEEGEGHPTVKKLEEFCEVLYEIHEEIQTDRGLSSTSAKTRLDHAINIVEKSTKEDIKVKKLVVFLPYKASMWDSLESVWMTAEADENTEAYVIPIPYFDRNPDGSPKMWHYEADQFPENVPITKFEEFKFDIAHPDEIYIHNPYDDLNYVTSVHSFFYSEHLKTFTEKLIYIPYFVLAEPDLDNEDAMKHLEGFVLSRGVINADEVIVQSENMKKAYMKILLARFGDDMEEYWDKKIKGTGSPKIERIKRLKNQEQQIPEEWKKIIYRPNGTKKKIVFYNTGVVAILNQEDKMIAKIKDVLQVFKECQEDVALLWRPHPLIQSTLDSMVPEISEEYKNIVKTYREEAWGIYDDTADMDRAIIISDAYYGDPSSIVQLYETLERPIMLQNTEVLCAE